MISNFDDHFNKLLKSLNSNNKFVIGLSGGVDSMALLHLIKNFIDDKRNVSVNCIPIIVDHNLRDESERESKEVKKISQNLGFDTQIKKINSCKPDGNIQNWARKERRNILFEKCLELSANLILGHHFDDQAETIVFNNIKSSIVNKTTYLKADFNNLNQDILNQLYNRDILSVIIEGGAITINSFIEKNLYDEIRVFTTDKILIKGVDSPKLPKVNLIETSIINNDKLEVYKR